MVGILQQIADGVRKATELISEVSSASDEQAQGIDQVRTAVAQMDKVTQSNAANAEESASTSEELSGQAKEHNDMVSVLVSIVGGTARNGDGRGIHRHVAAAQAADHKDLGSRVHGLLPRRVR